MLTATGEIVEMMLSQENHRLLRGKILWSESHRNYTDGYTYLINLIMLLPGPDPDFTLWLKEQIGISFAGGGVTPTVVGEFYINFGVLGMYIGMFLMGILGVYVYRYFRRHSDTFLGVFYLWQFAHCVSGGIANVMVTVLLYTIVYWCLMTCPIYLNKYRGGVYEQRKAIE